MYKFNYNIYCRPAGIWPYRSSWCYTYILSSAVLNDSRISMKESYGKGHHDAILHFIFSYYIRISKTEA